MGGGRQTSKVNWITSPGRLNASVDSSVGRPGLPSAGRWAVQAYLPPRHVKELHDLIGNGSLALHARHEFRIVQPTTSHRQDPVHDLLLAVRNVAIEPIQEQVLHAVGETQRKLDEDLRLEVETGGQAEVLVGRTGVTIGTAVLATPVRVYARVESDVGTRVAGPRSIASNP